MYLVWHFVCLMCEKKVQIACHVQDDCYISISKVCIKVPPFENAKLRYIKLFAFLTRIVVRNVKCCLHLKASVQSENTLNNWKQLPSHPPLTWHTIILWVEQ